MRHCEETDVDRICGSKFHVSHHLPNKIEINCDEVDQVKTVQRILLLGKLFSASNIS